MQEVQNRDSLELGKGEVRGSVEKKNNNHTINPCMFFFRTMETWGTKTDQEVGKGLLTASSLHEAV